MYVSHRSATLELPTQTANDGHYSGLNRHLWAPQSVSTSDPTGHGWSELYTRTRQFQHGDSSGTAHIWIS